MIEQVWYGDTCLSDLCLVVDVQRSFPKLEVKTVQVPSTDKQVLTSATRVPPTISAKLVMTEADTVAMREIVRELAPILMSKEPHDLSFESDGGLYYRAIVDGMPKIQELITSGSITVTWNALDAYMHGPTSQVTMTGTKTITVNGTERTPLLISGTCTPSSNYFGIKVDDQYFAMVKTLTNSSNQTIVIDCGNRTCKLNGVTKQLTLESDWLVLDAGEHTLAWKQGTGNVTVSWEERWL